MPGFGRKGLLLRALVAGLLVILMSGAAVAAAGLLQVKEIVHIVAKQGRAPIVIPNIDQAEAGKPETLLLLGSDLRYADAKAGNPARSDTIMLVRLDPDKNVIALLSIPRDLLTNVPGVGYTKINAAYSAGGEKEVVNVLKALFAPTGETLRINHVITISFGAFSRAVNYVGCVYADIDRHYFNDNSQPGDHYATIDVPAGYQKLCGGDALDYVRYRHGDSDLLRNDRQQDFLRQIRNQDGIRKLAQFTPGNLKTLARLFARYFDADRGLRDPKQILSLAKLVIFSQGSPLREVRFRAVDAGAANPGSLEASPEMLKRTLDEFLRAKASSSPRASDERTATRTPGKKRSKRKKGSSKSTTLPAGIVAAQTLGENQALPVYRQVGFPMYFPTVKTTFGSYVGTEPRVYKLKDYDKQQHDAYRMVVYNGMDGEYYGIQGMTWRDPPILDDPSTTIVRNGRRLRVYKDGDRVRMIAWRTSRAVYWVSNTLTQQLTTSQMLAIASSLKRFK
jgi:LCP family protein required for cell wall assembly